jgi:Ni/Fe-hydrogenase subunit HybB-like protein
MSDLPLNSADIEKEYPVVAPGQTAGSVTDLISNSVLRRPIGKLWLFGVVFCGMLMLMMFVTIAHLITTGIGIWGNNIPVGWQFDIINFVWWIGIGHAGTFISAFLLLLRQDWRTSINRFAEAMTLFAVSCAGLYPLLHVGRVWVVYFIFPYPNTMDLWPNFRSPLCWDVFAVSTYATVSLLFWYVGLIPDLATLRDRSFHRIGRLIYGFMAMGWRNSAVHWQRYQVAYVLLAGLAAPLVVSVHSIVGMDFASGQVPGWHTTIMPPYFVAGAIFSGFAMVLTIGIPMRKFYHLEGFITLRHLDNCAKLMLVTGMIVAYGYGMEAFASWYSGNIFEQFMMKNRAFIGPYWWTYWMLILCNVLIPQLLWFKRIRINVWGLWVVTIVINIGMWLERFVIIATSLQRDYLPSSWNRYAPTFWDWSMFIGTIGFFLFLFLLFIRVLPAISIAEMRELVDEQAHGEPGHSDGNVSAEAAI